MVDQFATGIAMSVALARHAQRRDLLMFSALPDAPVLPVRPPSRTRRAIRRGAAIIRAIGGAPRPGGHRGGRRRHAIAPACEPCSLASGS